MSSASALRAPELHLWRTRAPAATSTHRYRRYWAPAVKPALPAISLSSMTRARPRRHSSSCSGWRCRARRRCSVSSCPTCGARFPLHGTLLSSGASQRACRSPSPPCRCESAGPSQVARPASHLLPLRVLLAPHGFSDASRSQRCQPLHLRHLRECASPARASASTIAPGRTRDHRLGNPTPWQRAALPR